MSDISVADKLKEMAKLAILSNKISSIHEKNLRHYPFIAFEGVKSVSIDYDLSRDNESAFVHFNLTVDPTANNEYLDRRCKAIELWTRSLFWKDITINITYNDTSIYKSGVKND